jgi:hypothetical protein
MAFPTEVMEYIIFWAWNDHSLKSHRHLYFTLLKTSRVCRSVILDIAWKLVWALSHDDMAIYLHMRFSGAVDVQALRPHQEVFMIQEFLHSIEDMMLPSRPFPTPRSHLNRHFFLTHRSRIPDGAKSQCPLLLEGVRFFHLHGGGLKSLEILHDRTTIKGLSSLSHLRLLHSALGEGVADYHATPYKFTHVDFLFVSLNHSRTSISDQVMVHLIHAFPFLQHLELYDSMPLHILIRYLPKTLKALVLHLRPTPFAPHGTTTPWELASAIRNLRSQRAPDRQIQLNVRIVTGRRDPTGWNEVLLAAMDTGLFLEKISYYPDVSSTRSTPVTSQLTPTITFRLCIRLCMKLAQQTSSDALPLTKIELDGLG